MSIEVNDESGADIDVERVAALARYVLDRLKVHPQAELSVLAVDVDAMTALHVRYMEEEGPTDVLSFPMDELRPGRDDVEPEPGLLGDVVLCPEVAAEQAAAAGQRPGICAATCWPSPSATARRCRTCWCPTRAGGRRR